MECYYILKVSLILVSMLLMNTLMKLSVKLLSSTCCCSLLRHML